jgi:serine/threonine-protein phosphatase 2A regulatory subunit B
MFSKQYEYTPQTELQYKEKITCLYQKNENLWIGREDGFLECHGNSQKILYKAFKTDFDYLENEDIKPRITCFEHTNDGGLNDVVFIGNEKSIKVIKVRNDASTHDICNEKYSSDFRVNDVTTCKNVHNYILNSISLNRTKDYLISCDYIKINLWKPERMENFYNIVDLKPQLVDGAVFVINSCKFNPWKDNVMAYSSSNGEIYLNDISITPRSQTVSIMRNINTESIKSISDFTFIDENMIVSRSLNNLCLFDVRNTKIAVFSKELITNLDEQNALNSSDAIYEKFKISSDGLFAYTGSYFNSVYSTNVISGVQEEILVGNQRVFDVENKIKLVSAGTNGFSCVLDGSVYKLSYV